MGTRLLHVVCTPRGLASNTARVSALVLESLHERHEDLEVKTLDLFAADLPAVAGTNIKTKYALMTGQAIEEDARSSWREIERNIEQFLDADLYLLTIPMWNFGIPYALKYYIDAIVQPGYLFRYREDGQPEGLVHDRRMICVTSRGGDYSSEPLKAFDFVEPYLRTIFGFVGLTDIQFFNVQPMDISADSRRHAYASVMHEVRAWFESGAWDGAVSAPGQVPAGVKPAPIVEGDAVA